MKLNGAGARKNHSWIETFVDHTEGIESPKLFRKWSAITIIGAVLEQKVWMMTPLILYPNLYTFLVGHPGIGKTKAIYSAREYYMELDKPAIAPNSFTASALVDALVDNKRILPQLPFEPLEYNSMLIAADEMGTFMHQWDDEMSANLSQFYDPKAYGHHRRGNEIRIKIKSPQLSMLCGSTPSNLMKVVPELAWSQGLMSRIILIFSDEKIITDIFAGPGITTNQDLVSDLKLMNLLSGQCQMTKDFTKAVLNWRNLGMPPEPKHPRMQHYNTRRLTHLLKLCMISSVDHGATLLLGTDDFNRAMGWLLEAESLMPQIFLSGGAGPDSNAINDLHNFVLISDKGHGVSERVITNYARELMPVRQINDTVKIMEQAGLLLRISQDPKTGLSIFKAIPR